MSIQLIASDIDGTFLNDQRDFDHARFQAQLDELNRRHINLWLRVVIKWPTAKRFLPT